MSAARHGALARAAATALAALTLLAATVAPAGAAGPAASAPAGTEVATFAGGCFMRPARSSAPSPQPQK